MLVVMRRVMAVVLVLSFLGLGVGPGGLTGSHQTAVAQAADDTPIPSSAGLAAGCNATDLRDNKDTARTDPEWTPVLQNTSPPLPNDPPTILEGTVATPEQKFGVDQNGVSKEKSSDQAPSEVAEEDLPWTHFTHDKTVDVIPDPGYQHLLNSFMRADGSMGFAKDMEVEWDNASGMGNNHIWGAEPTFVWPSVRDRVWIDGRWIFDCGHPGSTRAVVYDADSSNTFSQGDTLIAGDPQPLFHLDGTTLVPNGNALEGDPQLEFVDTNGNGTWDPGETLVFDTNFDGKYDAGDGIAQGTAPPAGTLLTGDPRLKETLDAFPANDPAYAQWSTEIHPPRGVVTFRLNHPVNSGSWLPVTGAQTRVPVTEADAYFSGNGGLANDVCSLINRHIDAVGGVLSAGLIGVDPCNHTGPVIPINDRNYVFDIYPPGTDYTAADRPNINTPWPVTPPSADASLQWRTIDQTAALPDHACGNTAPSNCVSVTPIFCPIDASTPPPTQTETSCPAAPARPTRLRVILPFAGSNANVFAQTILLGWDTVPAAAAPSVRTFQITLHNFTVVHNGDAADGDWRLFVDVGGQWRYMGNSFDRNSNGDNVCNGDALTENGDGDCFQFDNFPWTVTVQDGTPIHIAVGGFESDIVDSVFCPDFMGCDPTVERGVALLCCNNDRIGTYEFDLASPDYAAPPTFTTNQLDDGEQYSATFTVQELPNEPPPASGPLSIGSPRYTNSGGTTFVTSSTPLTLSTQSIDDVGFQYRFSRDGTPLPVYPSSLPFPVHWTTTDFAAGPRQASVFLNANDGADGPYTLQYSAQILQGITEPRNSAHLTLDNTRPTIAINQPTSATYTHSSTLTLNYAVDDGAGSGVGSVSPTMDGAGTLAGHGLTSGQAIKLLTELSLGPHTFTVNARDNVGNAGSKSVTFTIIVTPQSIIADVNQFVASGDIAQNGQTPLLATLSAAANQFAAHNCTGAASIYRSFISQVQAQAGKKISASAAAILIADAQYLINHCS